MEFHHHLDRLRLVEQLSGNHRRVVSVRLRALEEACDQLEKFSLPVHRALTVRSELPPHVMAPIEESLSGLRMKIAEMKEELALEQEQIDPAREAAALVASMMVNVEETRPRYLKGYGVVPEELADHLEGQLSELSHALLRIRKAIQRVPGAEDLRG